MRFRAVLCGVLVACLLSVAVVCALKNLELQRRSEAREVAQTFALKLVETVNQAVVGVYMLSAAVDRKTGEVLGFDELSDELISTFPLIAALELAPKGVIQYVYPMRGNELILGHDLLVDKTRNREVHLAISRRQLALAGPLRLRQGGAGILARYPLYTAVSNGRSHFWGLSIGVIDFPGLLLRSGESEFARLGYRYEVCWRPQEESVCKTVSGEPLIPGASDIDMKISVLQAEWHLIVARPEGWLSTGEILLALLAVLLPSVAATYWIGWHRRR